MRWMLLVVWSLPAPAQAATGFATMLLTGAIQQTQMALHQSWVFQISPKHHPTQYLCHLEGALTGHIRQMGDGVYESFQ